MQSNARRKASGKPPRSKRLSNKGDSKTNNSSNQFSTAINQRKHIVRVKVLGLAGVTVRNDSLEGKPSTKGGMKRAQKKRNKAVLPPPSSLKAVVAFSRNQKVKGTSPPSLALARSPTTPIVLTGRQANMTPERSTKTGMDKDTNIAKQSYSSKPFERYIAVWEDAPLLADRDTVFETTLHKAMNTITAKNTDDIKKQNGKDDSLGKHDEHSMSGSTVTSTAFAPKSFDVTIALGDENYKRAAFSIGVATLAIAGNECVTTKKPKVVDLPILSLEQAKPFVGGKVKPWLPVIAMKNAANVEGDTSQVEEESEKSEYFSSTDGEEANTSTKKKNKGLKRFFRKKKKSDKPITQKNENESSTDSIKNLMTNAEEKVAFMERYGIDPSDAVLRVSIEVCEKGSELQKALEESRRLAKEFLNPVANNMSIEIQPSGEICQSRSKSIVESFSDDENSECDNSYSLYGDSLTTNTGTYQGSQSSYGMSNRASDKNSNSKYVLDNVLGACGAPCVQKDAFSAFLHKETYDDMSLDSESSANSTDVRQRRKSRRTPGRGNSETKLDENGKSKTSGSPRSVNDPNVSTQLSSHDSKTRSLEGNSLSYANSFNSNRSTSVMQTIKDVLQCSIRHDEEDYLHYDDEGIEEDNYSEDEDEDESPAPPDVIHSVPDTDSIGELTDVTYDYGRQIVKTKDLKLEVSPKLVLAPHGKALAGRVLLPAAFGGDGMCVSHGARLIIKEEVKKKKKNRKTEDYERIFFRQETELDPIQRSRFLNKNEPEHDTYNQEKSKHRDRSAQNQNLQRETFSDVCELEDEQSVGLHKNDHYENRAVQLSKTTSEEERVMFENDKYGLVIERTPIKQLREGY